MLESGESMETGESVTSRDPSAAGACGVDARRSAGVGVSRQCWIWLLLLGLWTHAGAEEEPTQGAVRYVELKPTFVTNYGYSEVGRLKYVKADISVRVHTVDAEFAIRNHLPQIRHRIVLLLSRQDEEGLTTKNGRERLRSLALESIREILDVEEGGLVVDDLLFTRFIVQR